MQIRVLTTKQHFSISFLRKTFYVSVTGEYISVSPVFVFHSFGLFSLRLNPVSSDRGTTQNIRLPVLVPWRGISFRTHLFIVFFGWEGESKNQSALFLQWGVFCTSIFGSSVQVCSLSKEISRTRISSWGLIYFRCFLRKAGHRTLNSSNEGPDVWCSFM